MAYMCADSGNLMAIAQQVIQQKQQRQRQQQQHEDSIVAGNAGDGHQLVPVASHWGGALQQSSSRDHFPYSGPEPIFSDPFASVDDPVDMLGMTSPGLLEHASFRLSDFGATAAAAISAGGFDSDEWMESLIGESPTHDSPNFMSRNLWQGNGARSDLPSLYTDAFVSCSTTLSLPPQATSSDLERLVFTGSHEIVRPPATDSVLSASSQSLPFDPPKVPPSKDAVGDGDSVTSNSKSTPFLFKSLLDCARIVDSEPDLAANAIMQVRDLSSNRGDPNERIAFYFAEALSQRLSASETAALPHDFSEEEMTLCYTAFNDACPYSKFVHLTTNQAILEATESADSIHIIDFGISQGVQWAALLQALATRPTGKPSLLRISGVPAASYTTASLSATGKRLFEFARLLGLEFAFEPVVEPVRHLTAASFRVEPREAVAINFTFHLNALLDEGDEQVECAIRLAKSLRPSIVTLGEFECRLNRMAFVKRFEEALGYFSAVFESVDAALPRDSEERTRVERVLLAPRILGAVGPEKGRQRTVRMETKERWKALMERCGLKLVPLSNYAVSQAKLLLWNYDYSPKYSLLDSPQCFLTLAWEDYPLYTVSSWR